MRVVLFLLSLIALTCVALVIPTANSAALALAVGLIVLWLYLSRRGSKLDQFDMSELESDTFIDLDADTITDDGGRH